MTEQTQYIATLPVGRTIDNGRAYLTIELRTEQEERQTITHGTITNPVTLSISGLVKGPKGYESAGQNRDEFHPENLDPAKMVISSEDLATITAIWDRWHLNTLKSACVHQVAGAHIDHEGVSTHPGGWFEQPYWGEMVAEQTARCPQGYRYGSGWLTEPLPDDIAATVQEIGNKYRNRSI